jgi:hypothetical protein
MRVNVIQWASDRAFFCRRALCLALFAPRFCADDAPGRRIKNDLRAGMIRRVTSTAGDANGLFVSDDSAQVGRPARIDDPVRQQQKQSAT